MDTGHVSKKTLIKSSTAAETAVFDLTQDNLDVAETISLTDLDSRPVENFDRNKPTEDILGWAAALLKHSPAAADLLRKAADSGWTVGLSQLHNNGYSLDVTEKTLLLDDYSMAAEMLHSSVYFRNSLVLAMACALRDIWHEEKNTDFHLKYEPEASLVLDRVRAADCDTLAILIAWELRGEGHTEIWRHLIGTAEGDMALVFSDFLERDPSALFDGSALAYAFRQWYVDETRVDASDHESLEHLDDFLLAAKQRNPFGTKSDASAMIERLSILPDGICYLAGLGRSIAGDPFFAGLNDPINQSHLFQIIYDMEVTMVNNVPFKDGGLAKKIFPGESSRASWK